MKRAVVVVGILVAMMAAQPVFAAQADEEGPEATLEGRAILPAQTKEEGSSPAPKPFPDQPVGGFSALVEASKGTYWAMPDNGYGEKGNSRDFLLRVYEVRPEFETASGGSGEVEILGFVQLRDPDEKVPFPIVDEDGTGKRLLTGGDFDIESLRIARDGTLWFGDEFGPFLLHTDATGRVLEAPIPLDGVRSPEDPTRKGKPVTLPGSSGFEGMAISEDRRFLYPSLEGALTDDPDQRRRFVYEFDLREGGYTGRRWRYRTEDKGHKIGDLTALDRHRLLAIERDDFEGKQAEFKKVFVVDLRRTGDDGFLEKREVVDLLDIGDPDLISRPARPKDVGIGDPFRFPYVTIESVLPLGEERLAVVNDNNFGTEGRNPARPDYSDFIVVRAEDLRPGG